MVGLQQRLINTALVNKQNNKFHWLCSKGYYKYTSLVSYSLTPIMDSSEVPYKGSVSLRPGNK